MPIFGLLGRSQLPPSEPDSCFRRSMPLNNASSHHGLETVVVVVSVVAVWVGVVVFTTLRFGLEPLLTVSVVTVVVLGAAATARATCASAADFFAACSAAS